MDYEYDSYYGYGNFVEYHYYLNSYTTQEPRTDPSQPMDFGRVSYFLEMFIICPVILIADMILFVKIVGNKKIRREPWRWLIANASFCTFFGFLMSYNDFITKSFGIPTLINTPLCGLVHIIQTVTWYMAIASTVILVTERFHALRLGKESEEGGMSKKSVVVTLVVFWVVLSLALILPTFITAKIQNSDVFSYYNYGNTLITCYRRQRLDHLVMLALLQTWAFLTFIVAIIGIPVMRNRQSTTDAMKQTIVNPTLAVSVYGLLFMATCGLASTLLRIMGLLNSEVALSLFLLQLIFYMAFPIIWLVTWSHNGDISIKCGGGNEGELKSLLEENFCLEETMITVTSD